jgi:NAD(P)-dependent dehydrogenase (short-subunit alcohol dehydrogenase family)
MASDPSPTSTPGPLAGRVALVHGAARPPGIGRATARQLAALGAAVLCTDNVAQDEAASARVAAGDTTVVEAATLQAVVDEIVAAGGRAEAAALDPCDPRSAEAAVHRAVMEFGRLDICCQLGGGTAPDRDRPLMALDDADWDLTVARNLTAVFHVVRAAASRMIDQGDGGAMVVLGSFAAVRLASGPPAFSAAKAGAEALTKLFAVELAPHRIRLNMVHPLCVDAGEGDKNPGLARNAAERGMTVQEWLSSMVPAGRFQSPDETAAVVTFLCGDGSSFTSGQAISVAGGALG